MSTESNQSSGNRHHGSSPEEERQHTGLFRRDDSENLVPSWSVPPGLMVPGPRQPQADDCAPPSPGGQTPDRQAPSESAADDNSWPGVAPPAGWFLRAAQPPPTTSPGGASPESASPESASPESTSPESTSPESTSPGGARPESTNAGGASPEAAGPWRAGSAVPSPRREPDGSWSSPLTPKPAPRALGPTRARHGRAGGPGFQPTRSASPATPDAAAPGTATLGAPSQNTSESSPWQRSHQLWSAAGIQWEQRPAPPQYPRPPRQQPQQPRQPQHPRQAPPSRPQAPPRHAAGRHPRPQPPDPTGWREPADAGWREPADAGWREPADAGWTRTGRLARFGRARAGRRRRSRVDAGPAGCARVLRSRG